jgi:hypothetical protein
MNHHTNHIIYETDKSKHPVNYKFNGGILFVNEEDINGVLTKICPVFHTDLFVFQSVKLSYKPMAVEYCQNAAVCPRVGTDECLQSKCTDFRSVKEGVYAVIPQERKSDESEEYKGWLVMTTLFDYLEMIDFHILAKNNVLSEFIMEKRGYEDYQEDVVRFRNFIIMELIPRATLWAAHTSVRKLNKSERYIQ